MNYEYSISVLMNEASKIGGELFAEVFIKKISERISKEGYDKAKKDLELSSFVDALLNLRDGRNRKEERFLELCRSIMILDGLSKIYEKKEEDDNSN